MNKTREDNVEEFHRAFGLDVDSEPSANLLKLRRTLIEEEVRELIADMDEAIALLEERKNVPHDLYANLLKEMSDVQIVLSGTSVSLKPLRNLEEAFRRVCDSNMTKLGDDGKPIYREDGKTMKGPNYKAPDLSDLV